MTDLLRDREARRAREAHVFSSDGYDDGEKAQMARAIRLRDVSRAVAEGKAHYQSRRLMSYDPKTGYGLLVDALEPQPIRLSLITIAD